VIKKIGILALKALVATAEIVGILALVACFSLVILQITADKEIKKTDYSCKLRNPNYCEMKEFLARDKTDSNEYNKNELKTILGFIRTSKINYYDCSNFSRDVKRNAIEEGIRCAGVNVVFTDDRIHAIVAFETVDRGVIFIESQTDEEVLVIVGRDYHPGPSYDYCSMGVVRNIKIYWPIFKSNLN